MVDILLAGNSMYIAGKPAQILRILADLSKEYPTLGDLPLSGASDTTGDRTGDDMTALRRHCRWQR